jgi:hypothetical protein
MAKKKKRASSGKRKGDQNLMLLAGAAAIIVGFFAIFSFRSQALLPLAEATPTPNPIVTVHLDTQNRSGESGTATLQEMNGKVIVTLNVIGSPNGMTQPAHIHIGSCPNPGAVKFPLTSVVNGQSVTTIDTTLTNLKALGPIAINVHKSVAQSGVYVSCGDINL